MRRYGWPVLVAAALTVWALNASRVGDRVEGCPEGCAVAGERRDGSLRVISLNILHGFPRFDRLRKRLDLIAEEVHRQDADIVCLQEVPWAPHIGSAAQYLAARTGLNHVYFRANGNRWTILFEEGEAILSRYPLRDVTFEELQPRAGFFEHRVVLAATAITPWGELLVFVTHLTTGDPLINRSQAKSLMAFVARRGEEPAIVAGDFNAMEDSPGIKAISTQAVDTYRAMHPEDPGFTCCIDDLSSAFPDPPDERIDYVFLFPGKQHRADLASCERVLDQPFHSTDGWQWASDHVGLLTLISIGE
ncbi:MAG: hypothetical protein CEE40_04740 [Chloroflexi bacterium B3_Chlor]|nr:MAG: hypothetical protein CEE40_04740 [Chloroflexi bacterium B3_Chlor]